MINRVKFLGAAVVGALMFMGGAFAAQDLCQRNNTRGFCSGNLGIPRREMPQIEGPARDAYLGMKVRDGFVVQHEAIPGHWINPTQNQINHDMVLGIIRAGMGDPTKDPCNQEVFVAKHDNRSYYAIDGHHRLTACKWWKAGIQKIVSIQASIWCVLADLQSFPGVVRFNFTG